tara:strand:+ start:1349 stop:2716 length:1368 start_codon:yes stop_codon:yes gene_type:complete
MWDEFAWILIGSGILAFGASFGIGANDVANSFSSSIGSNALNMRQATMIASVCEFTGALVMGSTVTKTVRKGIADVEEFEDAPEILMYGMMCVLGAVAMWLAMATKYGLPVSTTHSTIGAIIGMSIVARGFDSITWGLELSNEFPYLTGVSKIVASWLISPIMSGIVSFILFYVLKVIILRRNRSHIKAIYSFPIIVGMTMSINSYFIISKGSKREGWNEMYSDYEKMGISLIIGTISLFITACFMPFLKYKIEERSKLYRENSIFELTEKVQDVHDNTEIFDFKTESVFTYCQIFSAMCSSFAHGANDVANAIGPFAAVYGIYKTQSVVSESNVDIWVLAIGGVGIVAGLSLYGINIIKQIGVNLTKITPTRGLCIELAAAIVVIIGTKYEIPLSTTHCQIGAIIGVALHEGTDGINKELLYKIIFGWIITLFIAGSTSGLLTAQGIYAPYNNA